MQDIVGISRRLNFGVDNYAKRYFSSVSLLSCLVSQTKQADKKRRMAHPMAKKLKAREHIF